MKRFLTGDGAAGALFVAAGLAVIFILIPLGVTEPAKVQFAALSPSYYPRLVGITLAVFGLLGLIRVVRTTSIPEEPSPSDSGLSADAVLKISAVFAIMAVFYFLLEPLGFVPASALALIGLLLLAGERNPVRIALVAVLVPLCLHLFFTKVAGIPIPAGILKPVFLRI